MYRKSSSSKGGGEGMTRPKLPDPVHISGKLQPLYHKDVIDFWLTIPSKDKSKYLRAALRIIRDNPDILEKYLDDPPPIPQMAIEDFLNKTG